MPQTTTSDEQATSTPRWVWPVFGVLIPVAYLVGLNFPLVGPDEPRYAQVGREMMERGDWLTPTLGGHAWFEKPALLYWLEIISYKIFGVNEAAARLGPALFGIGTVCSLWLCGNTLRRTLGRDAGPWFALIGASTLGLVAFSHGASFDIIVTFPIAAALVCFWRFEDGEIKGTRRKPWLVGFHAFVGIALLAKGLIGVLFPYATVGLYLLAARRSPSGRLLVSLLWGSLITSVVAAVWYVPIYILHGRDFIDEFFIQHHFARFTTNKFQHPQPFYFFLWVLPLMTLPWLPFFLSAVWQAVRRVAQPRLDGSSPLILFALSWVTVPLVFFSVSGSKLPGYILPAVPGAAILAAIAAYSWARDRPGRRYGILIVGALIMSGAAIAALTVVPQYAADDSVKPLLEVATAAGHGSDRVLMLFTVAHGAEFYATGGLERNGQGQLVRHDSISEITDDLSSRGGTVLVLVPNEYAELLLKEQKLVSATLARNGELTMVSVSLR